MLRPSYTRIEAQLLPDRPTEPNIAASRHTIITASRTGVFLSYSMGFDFLGLPREIRDLIYVYVVEDVRYRHAFVKDADEYEAYARFGNVVRVTLESVPYLNLLLSHSQLYDEYRYAIRAQQRSARIRLDTLSELPASALRYSAYVP